MEANLWINLGTLFLLYFVLPGALFGALAYPLRTILKWPPQDAGLPPAVSLVLWFVPLILAIASVMTVAVLKPPYGGDLYDFLLWTFLIASYANGASIPVLHAMMKRSELPRLLDVLIGLALAGVSGLLLGWPWFLLAHMLECTYGRCL